MERLGAFFSRLSQRYLPDPLALACLLTLFVGVVAWVFPQSGELRELPMFLRGTRLANLWLDSIWNPKFLTFALQMCVVLLTGFGLARAPLALRGLRALANRVRTNRGAVMTIAFVSCAGCWINWGFGLILAGVLAGELRDALARRGVRCQFALIVASAYAGMMIWHGGFSGSAPLKVASEGVAIEVTQAGVSQVLQLPALNVRHTILSPANLGLTVVLCLGIPLVLRAMASREVVSEGEASHVPEFSDSPPQSSPQETRTHPTFADRINNSRALSTIMGLLLLAGVVAGVFAFRSDYPKFSPLMAALSTLNLNTMNSLFLAGGLLLHPNLRSYLQAVSDGGRAIVGIVMQFPLYAGIQGMMFGAGLAAAISQGFFDVAQALTHSIGVPLGWSFPWATFTSAGLVNFFVPSGGGQWIVQGPIMCAAGETLKLPIEQTVMAIAYGDQLTNMVQPFWAIPLMGLTRVDARQFMGYCALLMLLAIPVFGTALIFF